MDSEWVLPFGYPTEQFFGQLKNDIYMKQCEIAEKGGKQTFTSSFNLEDEDNKQQPNIDCDIKLFTTNKFHQEYKLKATITKKLLNQWKLIFRESLEFTLHLKEGISDMSN